MSNSRTELYGEAPQRTFSRQADQAAFLLGGIGTGNVSIGSRGELRDWEIFNRPAKGHTLPNTYFCIWAKKESEEPVAKVLESRLNVPHAKSHGYHPNTGAGLPHMDNSTLRGEYPFAWIDFEDSMLPVKVSLQAYTPLIPLNALESGIPTAILSYRVKNDSDRSVDVAIAGSIANPVGEVEYGRFDHQEMPSGGHNFNAFRQNEQFSGLFLSSEKHSETDLRFGNLSLVTTNEDVTYKRAWLRGAWFDWLREFWDDFATDGRLDDLGYETPSDDRQTDTGSLSVYQTLAPGEEVTMRFVLTWYFPNRINGWSDHVRVKEAGREIVQNHYADRFDSSWAVASYVVEHLDRLERETKLFHDALFGSTLPHYVIDALASNITALRSTTCFWLKDGRFLGYEGCFDDWGCCDGTCTHVWNYAQTLAFLFPALEQNMRKTEFLEEVHDDGKMNFRAFHMFDADWIMQGQSAPAAADGQMGTIMRVYREWKLTGDDLFVRDLWTSVEKALNFAVIQWDTDGDLVFDGEQHNTYDIEFYGPNPLTGVYFLGALRAAEEMAEYLGKAGIAQKYREAYAKSSKRLDELLWNGEYYVQRLDDIDKYKYQHGIGCLSDQLLGQQLAHVCGLGYLLPPEHVKKAVHAIYKYNFRSNFSNHVNCQRTFVLNDEQGLLVCSWPHGGQPKFPFVYSDEVFTGIEYQVATHLIYEGFIDEGLTIVKAVRDRHDGIKRNPWNEVECGHHYARSMASWGLLIALSGFQFDLVRKEMRFAPVIHQDDFNAFWSMGSAWGTYKQRRNQTTGDTEAIVEVLYGDASGITIHACGKQWTL